MDTTTEELSATYFNVISKRICENLKMMPILAEKVNKVNLRDFLDDFQHLNILEPIIMVNDDQSSTTTNHINNCTVADIPLPNDIDDFLINIDNISKKFTKPTGNVLQLPITVDQQQNNNSSTGSSSASSTTTTTTTTTTTMNSRERLGSTSSIRSVSSSNGHQDKNEYYNNADYELKSKLSDELINKFQQCKLHINKKKRLTTIDLLEHDIDRLQMFLEKFENIIKIKQQQQQQQREDQETKLNPSDNKMELHELLTLFIQVIDDYIFLKNNENIYNPESLTQLEDPLAECVKELLQKKY